MQTKRIGYRGKYTKKIIPNSKKHTIRTLKRRQKITKREIYGGGKNAKKITQTKKQAKELKKNKTPTREERQSRSKLDIELQKNVAIQADKEDVTKAVEKEDAAQKEVRSEESTRTAASDAADKEEEVKRKAAADKEKSDATKVDIRNTKEGANDDNTNCPSRNLTPRIPKGDSLSAKKKDYRKQALLFSPDKNIGCVKQSTDKVVILNKYWEDIQKEEEKGMDINAENLKGTVIDVSKNKDVDVSAPMLMSDAIESNTGIATLPLHKDEQPIGGNCVDIASFGIDIRYPNGVKESPIVNLIGNSGGTTDAVLSAMEIQSKKGKEMPDINTNTSTSLAIASKGGKPRHGKKRQKTKKTKKPFNMSMKLKKVKL